ncbi:MAG: GNAT family N-acetyltransferase [Flavobacteriaceae bacterium]|jgi:RimJ/RimL family protein N-acetyltransferase|nr:GNAT family N-acetyltransferase [Flavobacteriaceae bacterium]
MNFSFLTGNSVYLRGLEKDDLIYLKEWLCDEKVTHYLESGVWPLSIEQLDKQYLNELNNNISFLVILKNQDKPIGWGGLYDINWIKRSAELRFFIGDTKFWNMTSALESFKLLLEYSFKKLNLHKVTAGANVENKNSWKIIERIGFVKEGTIRDTIYRNGKYYDAYFYSILRNEYQKIYDSKSK